MEGVSHPTDAVLARVAHFASPRKALRGGISKVNFQKTLSSSGDKSPQNGSKNDPMAPRLTLECPHEGLSVAHSLCGIGLCIRIAIFCQTYFLPER